MADIRNPYVTLGVGRDADATVIVHAYRALARQFHPDIVGLGGEYRMREINAAWEVLGNPIRRKLWDDDHPLRPASRAPEGQPAWVGAAGMPPGRPSGSVLDFGRFYGWSLGEIARVDAGYLSWLLERFEGRPYRDEIKALLEATQRAQAPLAAPVRKGRFGRGR